MSELGRRQELFTALLGEFLVWLTRVQPGITARIREVQRKPEVAHQNALSGVGISNSLHIDSLAADVAIFRDGVYLSDSEDYRFAGEYWKSLHPLCRWGGDFKDANGNPKPDGNHMSVTYQGRQ
jgi:nitrous oxidase accessory protein NosD